MSKYQGEPDEEYLALARFIMGQEDEMSELEIVMAYTGWSAAIATAAIKQWKQYNPDWNAYYILEYLEEVKG